MGIEQQKGRLSKDEIDRIVKEAEKFKVEDDAKRAKVDARNQLESTLYQSQNQLGEKMPELNDYLNEQIEWVANHPDETAETYQAKMKEIQTRIQEMAQAAGGMPQGPGTGGAPPADNADMPDIDEI